MISKFSVYCRCIFGAEIRGRKRVSTYGDANLLALQLESREAMTKPGARRQTIDESIKTAALDAWPAVN